MSTSNVLQGVKDTPANRLLAADMVEKCEFFKKRITYTPAIPSYLEKKAVPGLHDVLDYESLEYLKVIDDVMGRDIRGAVVHANHEKTYIPGLDKAVSLEGIVSILNHAGKGVKGHARIPQILLPREMHGFILMTPEKEGGIRKKYSDKEIKKRIKKMIRVTPKEGENGPEDLYKARLNEDSYHYHRQPIDLKEWVATTGTGSANTGWYIQRREGASDRWWIVTHIRHREHCEVLNNLLDENFQKSNGKSGRSGLGVKAFSEGDVVKFHKDIAYRNACRIHALTAKAVGIEIETTPDFEALVQEGHLRPELAKPAVVTPYNYISENVVTTSDSDYECWFLLNKTTLLKDCVGGLGFLTKPKEDVVIYPFTNAPRNSVKKGLNGRKKDQYDISRVLKFELTSLYEKELLDSKKRPKASQFETNKKLNDALSEKSPEKWVSKAHKNNFLSALGSAPVCLGRNTNRHHAKEVELKDKRPEEREAFCKQLRDIYISGKNEELTEPKGASSDTQSRRIYDSSYNTLNHSLEEYFKSQGLDVDNRICLTPKIVLVPDFS